MRRRREARATAAAVLAGAVIALAVAVAAAQVAPAPVEGAEIADTGWWNRARPQVDLPTGPPPPPPVPGVPEGSLVVGATVGDPDAIAAVDIVPESLPGATVTTFELIVREVPDPGANLNTPFAVIVACPITEFWLGGENGIWETVPEFDCDLAEAPGARGDDGTWTWDLTQVGTMWSSGELDAQGVALVEKVEPPTSFRTAFAGPAAQGVGVRYVASGGEEPEDPFGGGGFDGGTGFDSPPPADAGGVGGDSGFSLPPVEVPGDAPTATTATTVDPGDDEEAAPAPVANGPISPLGTLRWWTWPLLALLVGAAVLCMLALGPGGEPLPATTRRGVTRALEARARTEEP